MEYIKSSGFKKFFTYLSYLIFMQWVLYVMFYINELQESAITINYLGIFLAFIFLPKLRLKLNKKNA